MSFFSGGSNANKLQLTGAGTSSSHHGASSATAKGSVGGGGGGDVARSLLAKLMTGSSDGASSSSIVGGTNRVQGTLDADGGMTFYIDRGYLAESVDAIGIEIMADGEVKSVTPGGLAAKAVAEKCSQDSTAASRDGANMQQPYSIVGHIATHVNSVYVRSGDEAMAEAAKHLTVQLRVFPTSGMEELLGRVREAAALGDEPDYAELIKSVPRFRFLSVTHPLHFHWTERLAAERRARALLQELDEGIAEGKAQQEAEEMDDALNLLNEAAAAADDDDDDTADASESAKQNQNTNGDGDDRSLGAVGGGGAVDHDASPSSGQQQEQQQQQQQQTLFKTVKAAAVFDDDDNSPRAPAPPQQAKKKKGGAIIAQDDDDDDDDEGSIEATAAERGQYERKPQEGVDHFAQFITAAKEEALGEEEAADRAAERAMMAMIAPPAAEVGAGQHQQEAVVGEEKAEDVADLDVLRALIGLSDDAPPSSTAAAGPTTTAAVASTAPLLVATTTTSASGHTANQHQPPPPPSYELTAAAGSTTSAAAAVSGVSFLQSVAQAYVLADGVTKVTVALKHRSGPLPQPPAGDPPPLNTQQQQRNDVVAEKRVGVSPNSASGKKPLVVTTTTPVRSGSTKGVVVRPAAVKKDICRDFQRGRCSYGDDCQYAHTEKKSDRGGRERVVTRAEDGDNRKRKRGGRGGQQRREKQHRDEQHDEPKRKRY